MSTIRKIKVCLNIKPGELTCPNPEIIWGSNPNILKNCVFKDGCIEVSILEDDLGKLKGKCIPYTIICDNCGNCPPKDGEACFCDNGDDCSNCQNCVTGVCVDKCPGKICKPDGVCVDCMDGTCPGNQQCIDGKCQCPPNKPYQDGNGNCYGCKSDTECPPCYKCDGSGNCVPRDCGNLACDPTLDRCVECVDSTKCKPNEVCINNKCECGPGYERDPLTGLCVVKPECKTKEQCGPCKHCIDGDCVDIKCPDGFKCVDDNCVPDPCGSKPCEDGTDCGEDCGCKDKVCTECASLSCEECAKSLGCVCNPVTGACEKKVTCDDEPCVTKYDCSQDCGCDQSECKDCANYSCEDCGKVPGCKCVNGKCIGDGDRGCKDTFTLAPDKCDATLTAKLTKTQPCACSTLTTKAFVRYTERGQVVLSIRKGTGDFDSLLPLISPKSKNNSETENQVESLTIKSVLTGLDATGKKVASSEYSTNKASVGDNIGVGPFQITGLTPIQLDKIVTVNIKVTLTNLKFKDNKCSYADQEVINQDFNPRKTTTGISFENLSFVDGYTKLTELTSDDFRDPLFIWYRSKDTSFSSDGIIIKQYISIANGSYTDKLTLDKGFLPKFDYRVETDCSCNEGVTLEDVVICEDIDLPIKLTQCNTRLEFLDNIKLCDLSNTNLAPYAKIVSNILTNTLADITYANTVFELLVNGAKVTEFKAESDKILKTKEYLYDSNVNITSVSLVVKVDGVIKCEAKKEFTPEAIVDPVIDVTCSTTSTQATIKIIASALSKITKVIYNEGPYTPINNVITIPVSEDSSKDNPYTYDVYFTSGCVKTYTTEVNCCKDKSITFVDSVNKVIPITETTLTETEETTFYLKQSGFSTAAEVATDYGTINLGNNLVLNLNEVSAITNSKTVKVTISENGCVKETVLKINRLPYTFVVSSPSCGEGTLTLTGLANAPYTISGFVPQPISGIIPSNGTAVISTANGASATRTYTLTNYNNFGVSTAVTYNKLSLPSVTSYQSDNGGDCSTKLDVVLGGTGLDTSTKVIYSIGVGGTQVETELIKNSQGLYVLSIDRPTGTTVNLYIHSVSNGETCTNTVPFSENITIKNPSNIQVGSTTCNTTTNLFSVPLNITPFNHTTDSVTFNPPLVAPLAFDSLTKILSGIPQNQTSLNPFTRTATVVYNGEAQCPQQLSIVTGSCTCQARTIASAPPTICKTTVGGTTTLVRSGIIGDSRVYIGKGASTLTFTSAPNSDIKVYLTRGAGPGNEVQLLPGQNSNNITYNHNYSVTQGALSIDTVNVASSFLTGFNVADLRYKVIVKAGDNYCETTFDGVVWVLNNLDAIDTSTLEADLSYGIGVSPAASFDFSSASHPGPLNLNLNNPVYINITSASSLPINALLHVRTTYNDGLSHETNHTFTGADVNDNVAGAEIIPLTGTIISGYSIEITREIGTESCSSVIKYVGGANIPGEFVYITRYDSGLMGFENIVATQQLCVLNSAEAYSHDYISTPVSSYQWYFDGVAIPGATGSTLLFDPASYNTNNIAKSLSLKLTLPDSSVLEAQVLIKVASEVIPTFNNPTTSVYVGYSSNVYPLISPSTNGIAGSWSPATLATDTPGSKSSTFTPTGGQCANVVNYTLNVIPVPVVSTPNILVDGPSSGCDTIDLNITLQNATQFWVGTTLGSVTGTPPPGSPITPPPGAYTYTAETNGTYYFKAYDGSTYSNVVTHIISGITEPTPATPSPALPSTFVVGTLYTLPSPVITDSGTVTGSWVDAFMTPVTSVNTTSSGTKYYKFIPTAGQCKTQYIYEPTVTCPTGTINISNITDKCATTLLITSSFYTSFSWTINGMISGSGSSINVSGLALGASHSIVITGQNGDCFSAPATITWVKCPTVCVGGPGSPCTTCTTQIYPTAVEVADVADTSPNVNDEYFLNPPVGLPNIVYNVPQQMAVMAETTVKFSVSGYPVSTKNWGMSATYFHQGSELTVDGTLFTKSFGETQNQFFARINLTYPNALVFVAGAGDYALNVQTYTFTDIDIYDSEDDPLGGNITIQFINHVVPGSNNTVNTSCDPNTAYAAWDLIPGTSTVPTLPLDLTSVETNIISILESSKAKITGITTSVTCTTCV